jgi:hypothetical protein
MYFSRPNQLVTILAVAMTAGLAGHTMLAQSDDPHAVVDKGAKVTGLTGADVPAFHLKATYSLYDIQKGNVTETGTLEEWRTGPYTWHRVYTEKKQTAQEWSTARTKQFKLKDNKLETPRLDIQVARPLLDPVSFAANYKPTIDMGLQAGVFEGITLNCVVASNPAQAAGNINPDALFPRLCFDVKDSSLRFTTTSDTMTAYSDFKPLGPRQVANKVEVKPFNRLGTAVNIILLEPLAAGDQAQVTPPGNAAPQPYAHQSSDPPLVPVRITECEYPIEARNNQERGVAYIPIIIKKDGSVKSNGPAFVPNAPHLSSAASDCPGNYKFQPFLLDGEPVEVSDALLYPYDGKPFNAANVTIASQPPPAPAKK